MTEPREDFFSARVFGDPDVLTAITTQPEKGRVLVRLASTGLRFAASTVALTSALALHDSASTHSGHLTIGTTIAAHSRTTASGLLRKADRRVFVNKAGRRGRYSRDTIDWSIAPAVPVTKKITVFPRRVEVRRAVPDPVIDDPTE
jgi:hypothetical protein